LRELRRPGFYETLEQRARELETGWSSVLHRTGIPATVVRVGSILWLSLQEGAAPRTARGIDARTAARYGQLHAAMLARGVWLAPSAYEVAFLSAAHTEEHVALAVDAMTHACSALETVAG